MKQNNRKKTWKAIVAVVLVMVSLFTISTAVSAEFVELIFDEKEADVMLLYSSNDDCDHIEKVHKRNEEYRCIVKGCMTQSDIKIYECLTCGKEVEESEHQCSFATRGNQ